MIASPRQPPCRLDVDRIPLSLRRPRFPGKRSDYRADANWRAKPRGVVFLCSRPTSCATGSFCAKPRLRLLSAQVPLHQLASMAGVIVLDLNAQVRVHDMLGLRRLDAEYVHHRLVAAIVGHEEERRDWARPPLTVQPPDALLRKSMISISCNRVQDRLDSVLLHKQDRDFIAGIPSTSEGTPRRARKPAGFSRYSDCSADTL